MVYTHITTLLFAQTFTKRNSIQRMGGRSSLVEDASPASPPSHPHARPSPGSWCHPLPLSAAGWPGSACLAPPYCDAGSAHVSALLPLSPRTVRWGQPSRVGGWSRRWGSSRCIHWRPARLFQHPPTHLLSWMGHLTPLSLCFSIDKVGMVILSIPRGCWEKEAHLAGTGANGPPGLQLPKVVWTQPQRVRVQQSVESLDWDHTELTPRIRVANPRKSIPVLHYIDSSKWIQKAVNKIQHSWILKILFQI